MASPVCFTMVCSRLWEEIGEVCVQAMSSFELIVTDERNSVMETEISLFSCIFKDKNLSIIYVFVNYGVNVIYP